MIESVLLSVLKTSVIVSAVTLPIMVLRQLILKKRTAKWLYFLFLILFIRLVLPFDITLPKGFVIDVPEIIVKTEQNIPENITPSVPISGDVQTGEPSYIVGDDVGHMSNPLPTVPYIPENSEYSGVTENTADEPTKSISLFEVLGFVYIVGFAIYFILQVISYILMLSYLKRNSVECVESSVISVSEGVKKELGITRKIPIMICPKISAPTLAGLFKPMIFLPENSNDTNYLEYIFRHEYTHYKHGDLYFKLLALIANGVHWFNPIIYLLRKEAEKVVEFVCDSRVVASFDGQLRSEYCNVIVDEVEKTVLHRKNAGYLTTSFTGNAKTLKERLSAILNTDKKHKGIVSFVCIMLFIAIIGVTVSCNLDSESLDEGLEDDPISSNEDPKEDPVEENNETNLPDEKENSSEGELSGEPIPENVVVKPSVEYVVSDGSFYTPFVDVGEGDLINELYSYVLKPFRSEYLELVYQNEKVTVDTLDDYIIQMTVFAVFGIEGLEVRTEMTTLGYERELTIYPASLMEERAKLIYGDGVTINHATFYPLYYHTAEYVADGDYYRFANYELEPQQLSRKSNFTEYLRSEKSGDYVYIYDRFYSLEEDGFRRNNIYACSAGECLIAEALGYGKYRQVDKSTGKIVELNNVDAILPEYKHTFKKDGNGNYHWVSTEPVTDISAIVLKEDSQAELSDAVLAEKLYNYIIKYDYRNSELVYRDGVTTAEDLSDYLKRYTVFKYFGLDGLERKLSGHLWQDSYMARIVFIYPESLMNERIKMIFGKDATVEHGDSSWVDGLSVVYSATDKCYYISAYDGGGDRPNLNYVYFAYYKNNGNEFIIYDRYAYVEYSSSGYDVYQGSLGKEYVTTLSDVKSVANYATVYKHTFKKASDGSYYWYSTEQADVTNNIAAEVGFENIIPTEKGSVEEPENPVDPWSPAPPFPEPPLPVPVPVG